MSAQRLNGTELANQLYQNLTHKIASLPAPPQLVVIQVLGDEASSIYIKHKLRIAEQIGVSAQHITFPSSVEHKILLDCIHQLNQDKNIHGILLQLPLPSHLSANFFLDEIAPEKDVDGLCSYNLGRLMRKEPGLRPCTPLGIMTLLEHYGISLPGKNVVILNSSPLVGKPLAMMMTEAGATPTLCHSRTLHAEVLAQQADILVSATGKPQSVPGTWIKLGAVVIDVGVHRGAGNKLLGDVIFDEAAEKASWITPVPGGVGPMTIAMLMKNLTNAS